VEESRKEVPDKAVLRLFCRKREKMITGRRKIA